MANSYHHAVSSARCFGGTPADYQPIHDFLDSTKMCWADQRHRAILHNTFGCFLVEKIFGHTITLPDGREVPTRLVAEQHIREDTGHIPSIQDWLEKLPLKQWMLRGARPLSRELEEEAPSPEVREPMTSSKKFQMSETKEPSSDSSGDSSSHRQQVISLRNQQIQNLVGCCLALVALNVTRIEVKYSGACDEGAIEEILALGAAGQTIPLPPELDNQIVDGAYGLLPPGFEQESGSFGTLKLDVANRTARLDHNNVVRTIENEVIIYDLNQAGGDGVDSTG